MSPQRSFCLPRLFSRRVHFSRGFTLVEILTATAIVSVLAAIALPAYNTYAIKSRFIEVVTATNPTKSFISVCAADGSCVQNNQIYLDFGSLSVPAVAAVAAQPAVAYQAAQPAVAATNPWGITDPSEQQKVAQMYAALVLANNQGLGSSFGPATFDNAMSYLGYAASSASFVVAQDPNNASNSCFAVVNYDSNGNPVYKCQLISAGRSYETTSLPTSTTPSYAAISGATPAKSAVPEVASQAAVAAVPAQPAIPAQPATTAVPCVDVSSSTTGCSASTKYVLSVNTTSSGVITATAQSSYGLHNETYVLIPSYSSGRVDWSISGSCRTAAGGKLC